MEHSPNPENKTEEAITVVTSKSVGSGTYGPYCPTKLDFDPLKDLNLPDSYDEVLKRFKGLQGERAVQNLN